MVGTTLQKGRRPGYKQTDVGVIPDDWEVRKIDDIAEIGRGRVISHREIATAIHSLYPVYSSQTSDEGVMGYIDTYDFEGEYVTWTTDGVNAGTVFYRNGRFNCTNVCGTIRLRKDSALFISKVLGTLTSRYVSRNLANPKLMNDVMRQVLVPLPPASEQRAIASVLSDVDGLISSLDTFIAKKRDLRQAAVQQLLTGKKRLPGFSGDWEMKRIGEFTDCTAGGTPSTMVSAYWGGPIRWMNSGDLNLKIVTEVDGRITQDGLKNSSTKVIPAKCILVGLAGQGKTRGTVAINLVELCTNQSIAAIFPSPAFIPEYLYYNLDARYEELRGLSTGDGGRGGLNLTIIKSVPVPLPDIPEQAAIAAVLCDMDADIAALETRRNKARALKQGMMQQLLTGKIRLI